MKRVIPSSIELYVFATALAHRGDVYARQVQEALAPLATDGRTMHSGGQVSSALTRLADRGHLEGPRFGENGAKIYSLTPAGRKRARAALAPLQTAA